MKPVLSKVLRFQESGACLQFEEMSVAVQGRHSWIARCKVLYEFVHLRIVRFCRNHHESQELIVGFVQIDVCIYLSAMGEASLRCSEKKHININECISSFAVTVIVHGMLGQTLLIRI